MDSPLDKKIKEKLARERVVIPNELNAAIHNTLQNLPRKKQKNNLFKVAAFSVASIMLIAIILLSNNHSPTNNITMSTSIQKSLSLSEGYEKLVDKYNVSQVNGGIKLLINSTVFDGYQLFVNYQVESDQAFKEKPTLNGDNAFLVTKETSGEADYYNEYGEFEDKEQKVYKGTAIFTINKGNLDDSIPTKQSSNPKDPKGEKHLQGQKIEIEGLPNQFLLNLHVNNLGDEEKGIAGSWSFSIPIKSEKAKKNAKEITVMKSFTEIDDSIKIEKVIITPIRIYVQSTTKDSNDDINYVVVDDKGNSLKTLGGSIAGYYDGEQRNLASFENKNMDVQSLSIIPYLYSKSNSENRKREKVILHRQGETVVPLDSKGRFFTITKAVERQGKTYVYYQSQYPVGTSLPFILVDQNGREYIRNMEESIISDANKESILIYDEYLLEKDLEVINPNTIYYEEKIEINIE